ncbi:MAG: MATE family efflux transporter [Candidatus Margulisbacteria bacterium]|nr:MATE family efflux transporter [Candidatus Margulisiibacteriota bacterium]
MIKKLFQTFQKERDLTTLSITKGLFLLAVPMIVSNVLQTAFNVVDMIWVGRLGASALAAVAMSGQIIMVVMFVMIGIGVGTTAKVARAIGEKNKDKADNVAMQSLILGFFGSIIFAVIGYYVSPWLLEVLGAQPDVVALGTSYLRITFLGVIVMFYGFLISAILQGAGDAVTPMLILAGATVLNIVLDPIMIFWLGWGVNGAALATVISRALGSLVALEVLLRGRSRIHVKVEYFKIDWEAIRSILLIGFPASIQMTLRGAVGIVLISVVASFGTFAVAAYGVGLELWMIAMMPGFALGMSAATLVGQNLGAKQLDRAFLSAWTAAGYYTVFMFFMCLMFLFAAPYLVMMFNTEPEVVRIGSEFLRIAALGTIFVAPSLILGRSMSGAGDTTAPLVITFITLWVIQIPLAFFLARFTSLGLTGIWLAILIAYLSQAVMTISWFQVGKWKHKRV